MHIAFLKGKTEVHAWFPEFLDSVISLEQEMKLQHVSKSWASAVVAGEHASLTLSRQQDKHQK